MVADSSTTRSVLVVNPPLFATADLDALRPLARLTIIHQDVRPVFKETLRRALEEHSGFDALLVFRRADLPRFDPMDEDLLSGLIDAGLKFITGGGAGFDLVDIDYLSSRGVTYANNPTAVGVRTADSTSAMILQVLRGSSQMEAYMRSTPEGLWRQPGHIIRDARHSTLGIIGLGNIGQLVARQMGQCFGMRVIYTKRTRLPPSEEHGAMFVSLDELLAQSDVISVLCPLNAATRNLLSYPEFAKMKDGVLLVNTARGAIVDEPALLDALSSGKALDVYPLEPALSPALLASPNVSLAPHIAANTERVRLEIEREQLANVRAWLKTGRANTAVN